jgi:PAS domain S-box-containing protein
VGREIDPARLAFLEAVVDASFDAVFEIVDGTVTSWNRSAERLFGRSEDEAVGASALELFPGPQRPSVEWLLGIVGSGDHVERFETEVQRGSMPTPIALTLRPVATGDDSPAVAAIAHDLTEQRLAQATMAETEARLREGEALAHTGRWLWDVATGAVQWSDELHRIHGVEPWDFAGDLDAHLALVVEEDRSMVAAAMEHAVERHRCLEVEYHVIRSDGVRCRLHSRAEPTLAPDGRVIGLRGVISVSTRASGPITTTS